MTLSAEFYGPTGEPVGGIVPPSIHIFGDGDHDRALQAAEGRLNSFMHEVRLSTAPHHRIEVDLGEGATALMRAAFGVVTVDILTSASAPQGEPFYGGILLPLKVMSPDNAAAYAVDAGFGGGGGGNLFRPDLKYTPSHVKSAGYSAFKEGRPAVPGTEDEDLAEWLVVQIAKDKPLANGIETGAVKIYRIANFAFGAEAEINDEEGTYLLSTSLGTGEYRDFYYCGKRVESIPPLTVIEDPVRAGVRIRTVGFGAPSFELGANAGGIVIMAVERRLYALNTASEAGEPATWKLLDTGGRPAVLANTYGTEFTETVSNGALTVVCSGTNGVGPCSGFSVTITPVPGKLPTITGRCNIVASPDTLEVVGTKSHYVHSASYTFPGVQSFTSAGVFAHWETGGWVVDGTAAYPHSWTANESLSASTTVVPASGGAPARTYDRFLGGEVPLVAAVRPYEYAASFSFSRSGYTAESNSVLHPLSSADHTLDESYAETGMTIVGGTTSSMFTGTRSFLGGSLSVTVTDNVLVSHSAPTSHSWGELEVGKRRYSATDRHSNKLAFRYDQGRSGSMASSSETVTHFSGTGNVLFSAVWATTLSAWRFTHRLLRPDGTAVAEWNNMASLMPGITPFMAAQTLGYSPSESYRIASPMMGMPLERAGMSSVVGVTGFPELTNIASIDYWRTDIVPGWPAGQRPPDAAYLLANGSGDGGRHSAWSSWSVSYTQLPGTQRSTSLGALASERPSSLLPETIAHYNWLVANFVDPIYHHAGAVTGYPGPNWMYPPDVSEVIVAEGPEPYAGSISSGEFDPVWPRPGWDRLYELQDRVLYDSRTGGFIAQMYWGAEHTDDASFPDMMIGAYIRPTYCEILIGNSTGTVPLQDILNAWKELGETAGAPDEYLARAVFIDHAYSQDVMLL